MECLDNKAASKIRTQFLNMSLLIINPFPFMYDTLYYQTKIIQNYTNNIYKLFNYNSYHLI